MTTYVKSGKFNPDAALKFLRDVQEGLKAIHDDAVATAGGLSQSQSRHYQRVMAFGISIGDMAQALVRTCHEIENLKSTSVLL